MNRLVTSCLILFACAFACAEDRNVLYVEYGGNAGLYSINYDRAAFVRGERHRFGGRLGLTWAPFQPSNSLEGRSSGAHFVVVAPLMAVYQFGPKEHRLELGAGVTPKLLHKPGLNHGSLSPAASVNYRFQRFDNGFTFRIGFTPLFFDGFTPWAGLSVGRAF